MLLKKNVPPKGERWFDGISITAFVCLMRHHIIKWRAHFLAAARTVNEHDLADPGGYQGCWDLCRVLVCEDVAGKVDDDEVFACAFRGGEGGYEPYH